MNNKKNPFAEQPISSDGTYFSLSDMYPKAYNKHETTPFTKIRIILANGAEFEAQWFLHNFARHCADNDIRRKIAEVRKSEQQQQKRISCLKPISETVLETTIGYEQLAVELTAIFARREANPYVKQALDFALLEDFDHLYRYADLLNLEHGIEAKKLVGGLTEIMPGRPTIAEHRFPWDDVKRKTDYGSANPLTRLDSSIIVAAEQQTMNYYMNQAGFYTSDLGRKLYAEIAMIEEQHVTQYESLMDPTTSWLECWLMHEYTECYLYYSLFMDETDPYVKSIWGRHYEIEVNHLHVAAQALKDYERKEAAEVIPDQAFPELISFEKSDNVSYIREVLKQSYLQGKGEDWVNVNELPSDAKFFDMQRIMISDVEKVPSHEVIEKHIKAEGKDYRFQTAPHPIKSLDDVKRDNVSVARKKEAVASR